MVEETEIQVYPTMEEKKIWELVKDIYLTQVHSGCVRHKYVTSMEQEQDFIIEYKNEKCFARIVGNVYRAFESVPFGLEVQDIFTTYNDNGGSNNVMLYLTSISDMIDTKEKNVKELEEQLKEVQESLQSLKKLE
jgi:hypothetical protein